MTNKVSGFSKDWGWKEKAPVKKKNVSRDAEARAATILKLRQKGYKISYAAGRVGLARKVLAEDGKVWRGKMNKSSARKIIRQYAFGKEVVSPHIKQSSENFYRSREWRQVRYEALVKCGRACMCCGAKPADGIVLHVDHVKPRSKYPQLELDINNLQILCEDCNLGKSNIYEHDFR